MRAFVEIVGADHVLTDADLTASYETDWTGRFSGKAACVVRPRTTAEVAAVLKHCHAEGLKVVVQGGNTGLVGGGVPAGGEVLLSLARLTDLGDVDLASAQVTAGAGVTLADLQIHARASDLDFGVDLAARESATVGGLVATNAGGIRVLRYGSMRAQVMGLEAVLADGSVISRMAGLSKDGTGYDLAGLIAGSEGTLAVVTAARLKLWPRLRARAVALLAMDSTEAAVSLLPGLRASLPSLSAAELFYREGLALVRKHGPLPAPFPQEHEAYLLLECADLTDPVDQLAAAVSEAVGLVDATVATDAAGQRALWAYRETHTESISAEGVPVKLDVSVPTASLPLLVSQLSSTIAGVCPAARPIVFGHVNEGNLHVNVLDTGDLHEQVTDAVLRLVASLDGSISSEHGVGRAKVEWLQLSRSATEIAAMQAVKRALDPAGILNPGVLLP
ncbi:MAG: linked oxidase domain protein [Frankiales bacterium]|nr:linked oxidase domain protein [Frankiales bacterium]